MERNIGFVLFFENTGEKVHNCYFRWQVHVCVCHVILYTFLYFLIFKRAREQSVSSVLVNR